MKGKTAHLAGVEFGEVVHWKERVAAGALAKIFHDLEGRSVPGGQGQNGSSS